MKGFIAALLLISSIPVVAAPVIPLKKGLVINSSVIISRETYFLNTDTSLLIPLIIIEGKDLTVDFNNCILQGSGDKILPNEFYGLAVLVKQGSSNIIIKNANIHGFKIAIMADSVEGLQIEGCDLSYNYRQHLHSNWKREDISDWMSYHHNEHDEWMRYGAGIYLKDCDHAIIKNNSITGGQCGLMMMRCDSNEIYNNNFSFNSGIGIGLYRSSGNKIYANVLDFNVRGYSDGVYNRGQDSAGILVFEQCNNNVFANNSVTHGGDGFFLWAGQHTMDTGEGGCNDNLIFGNDFSYAPTNGVEVTFSMNYIGFNEIAECDHGIWGGYSYNTLIESNGIQKNKTGIAIEHGQAITIRNNYFDGNVKAIDLWARKQQPPDWIYAQRRDTRSMNYNIYNNSFKQDEVYIHLTETENIHLNPQVYKYVFDTAAKKDFHSALHNMDSSFGGLPEYVHKQLAGFPGDRIKIDSSVHSIDSIIDTAIITRYAPQSDPNFKKNKTTNIDLQGRHQIRITPWGPYDFQYPLLWLKYVDSIGLYHFEVLTPAGNSKPAAGNSKKWQLNKLNGFHIVENSNSQLTAKADSSIDDRFIQLEYDGAAFINMFGKKQPANQPYIFGYKEFDPHFNWNIQFFIWDSLHDPQKNYTSFYQSLTAPVYSIIAPKVDYTWWGAIGKDLPADSFATVATASVNVKEGNYVVGVTADDMAKLFVDGKEIIDAWDPSYTALDENTHHDKKIHVAQGAHEFKIVHAEIGGLATLMFYFDRAP